MSFLDTESFQSIELVLSIKGKLLSYKMFQMNSFQYSIANTVALQSFLPKFLFSEKSALNVFSKLNPEVFAKKLFIDKKLYLIDLFTFSVHWLRQIASSENLTRYQSKKSIL